MKAQPSAWSHTYYTLITHSEKVGHSSFLIYSLAQSDHMMKCEMLQSYCQDMKPKTVSRTTATGNKANSNKFWIWIWFYVTGSIFALVFNSS